MKNGTYLINLFKIKTRTIGGQLFKIIKQNNMERYQFLDEYKDFQIPELIADFTFKIYYTLSYLDLINLKDNYIGTLNELFRERLNERFANYSKSNRTP